MGSTVKKHYILVLHLKQVQCTLEYHIVIHHHRKSQIHKLFYKFTLQIKLLTGCTLKFNGKDSSRINSSLRILHLVQALLEPPIIAPH